MIEYIKSILSDAYRRGYKYVVVIDDKDDQFILYAKNDIDLDLIKFDQSDRVKHIYPVHKPG